MYALQHLSVVVSRIIVGSGHREDFPIAFNLLCKWEGIRGAFWVVQTELLRHAAINLVEGFVAEDVTYREAKVFLKEMLPSAVHQIPPFIQHGMVIEKLIELNKDFLSLLESMKNESSAMVTSVQH